MSRGISSLYFASFSILFALGVTSKLFAIVALLTLSVSVLLIFNKRYLDITAHFFCTVVVPFFWIESITAAAVFLIACVSVKPFSSLFRGQNVEK